MKPSYIVFVPNGTELIVKDAEYLPREGDWLEITGTEGIISLYVLEVRHRLNIIADGKTCLPKAVGPIVLTDYTRAHRK